MRVVVIGVVAGILVGNAAFAQDVGPGMTGHGRGILASAERAALRVELQPNAGAQRARRSGRMKAGWTLVVVGGGLVLGGMYLANRNEGYFDGYSGRWVSGGSGTTGVVLSLAGLGLAGLGGVFVARADVSSRVRLAGDRLGYPFGSPRERVAHTGR